MPGLLCIYDNLSLFCTSLLETSATKKENSNRKPKENEDTDLLDSMITYLAELLEEKGIITQEKWELKIKKNLKS
jgi:hypothetical protein